VTLCERAPRLPASPSLITFRFHSLVVALLDMQERVFMSCMPVIWQSQVGDADWFKIFFT